MPDTHTFQLQNEATIQLFLMNNLHKYCTIILGDKQSQSVQGNFAFNKTRMKVWFPII